MKDSILTRFLVTLAAFVVVVAGIRAASSIIVPFLLATFLAMIVSPAMVWMRKKGVRSSIAILLVLLLLFLILYLVMRIAGTSLASFIRQSDTYQVRLQEISREWVHWLRAKGVAISSENLTSILNPATAFNMAANTLSGLGGLLTNTFLILLTIVFILLEGAGLPNKLRMALGADHPSFHGIKLFTDSLNRYLVIKTIISLITGFLVYLLVRAIGINFAPLWGLLAFILNYVPNIGSIIAAVPSSLLALVQLGEGPTIVCILGYVAINVVMGNLVEPRAMGKNLGLSTLVVFLSLVFWGWVLGPVGMLLSVPLTMIVKIAMESNRDTAWIGILLGSDPGEAPASSPTSTNSVEASPQ